MAWCLISYLFVIVVMNTKVKQQLKILEPKKINCNFQLVGLYIKQYDGWTLRVICDQHNHPPAQYMEGHAFARRLKEREKQLVADLTNMNVTPHDKLSIIKERDVNNVSTLKIIYNERLKLHSSRNYGKTPMQVLMEILNEKHFVTDFSVNSISNELENLFFIHPQSLNIWKAFPHILIIDATYKTNKYGLPFVRIVGTTSTNKTFSIAFAFIVNEKESYNWLLTCLKSTLDKCMHPRVIAIDRELALMNACQQVFAGATRLLCRWHITKNITKLWRRRFKIDDEWKAFRIMWTVLVDSPTWIVYNDNYKTLQSMLRKYQDVLNYLDEVWLNKYKEMFVSVWIDQHLNFGQRTTNRVESAHSNLKKYLDGTNSYLDKFIGCLDQFVRSRLPSIHDSLEKSRTVRKREQDLPFFRLLWVQCHIKLSIN
ncbi:PKS-NRPS hybrid synthetase cheA-like [Lactuca sativa]|uniref:PKS-NRPS hybrid synthetase cheA-like n=1 Tax=Lactuca sativa TaxID=4236 RepID=UPI001C68F509|nr:PKS-NRPS hybrid synthetase cheA-like [Lactuca sativa]